MASIVMPDLIMVIAMAIVGVAIVATTVIVFVIVAASYCFLLYFRPSCALLQLFVPNGDNSPSHFYITAGTE